MFLLLKQDSNPKKGRFWVTCHSPERKDIRCYMGVVTMKVQSDRLREEIMLQCNERLYIAGIISRELYEQAKIKIVSKR